MISFSLFILEMEHNVRNH